MIILSTIRHWTNQIDTMYTYFYICVFFSIVVSKNTIWNEVEFIDKNSKISAFDCSQPSDLSVHRYGEEKECTYENETSDEPHHELVHFQVLQKYRKVQLHGVKCTVIKSIKNFFAAVLAIKLRSTIWI